MTVVLEYPPIFSIVLSILTLLLLIQIQLSNIFSYNVIQGELGNGGGGGGGGYRIDSSWDCDTIRGIIAEEFPYDDFVLSKETLADTFKKLIECEIFDMKKDKTFINQFSDWESFYCKYPKMFEELGGLMKFEDMTSDAIRSLPVPFILSKIENNFNFIGFINKLPMKKILNYLITNDTKCSKGIWKIFTEQVFNEMSFEERFLLMKYFKNLVVVVVVGGDDGGDDHICDICSNCSNCSNCSHCSNCGNCGNCNNYNCDDVVLLLVRIDNFLVSSLLSLKEGKLLWNEHEDDWIERFSNVEMILEEYLKIRRRLKQKYDKKDGRKDYFIKRFLIDSPVSINLKDAIKSILIKKETDGVTAILSNVLLIPKPFDPNIGVVQQHETLSKILLKYYKIENLINNNDEKKMIEEEIIKDSIVLLEFLRSFSNDSNFILNVLESVDVVYTEKFPVCQWMKRALELGSPKILNFFYLNYRKLVKSEISEIFEEAKKEEMIKNIWNFFVDAETEMELKFHLLLPLQSSIEKKPPLHLDFIDNNVNLQESRTFLEEAYMFYLNKTLLAQERLNVKFRGMNGQDTGGLSRHFLMVIFKILIDEEYGLFHISSDGKVIPRTLLDPNILGFIGMLHGQALKSSLKVPWLIDFNFDNQPIKSLDLIRELERNNESCSGGGGLVPSCHDILKYLNDEYRLFHDRFDISVIKVNNTKIDFEYLKILESIEQEIWRSGEDAYKRNLLSSVDRDIVKHVDKDDHHHDHHLVYNEILNLLRPLKSSEIDSSEFLNCLNFKGEAKELIKSVFETVITDDPRDLIPATLKFVTGSIELPPAGLASLNLVVNTFVTQNFSERRLPQASTCHKIINWTISCKEDESELIERLKIALKETSGFELE